MKTGSGSPISSGRTLSRLVLYLQALDEVPSDTVSISSGDLGERSKVTASVVRRDLMLIGAHGVRGVGYTAAALRAVLLATLRPSPTKALVVIGMGNLGRALVRYIENTHNGLKVIGAFDCDEGRVGESVGSIQVQPMSALPSVVHEEGVTLAILATSANGGQDALNDGVRAGLRVFLSLVPTTLLIPQGILVREIDLAGELQVLSFHTVQRVKLSR